ncbi:MAG: nucleotidyl transferase AbiEii/AbiGii toxin family protein [Gammaproteobacteria bacterium]
MELGSRYFKQVELLVQILPLIARYECFALKGGTAINLFVRDLPRLSVDIDLSYVRVNARDEALQEIDQAFRALKADVEQLIPGIHVHSSVLTDTRYIYKLVAQLEHIQVKIEISPVMRGVFEPLISMETSAATQENFGFAELPVVSFNDLYAGKLCAALSRQHPRDLFDVRLLLENEGISQELLDVFIIYLVSSGRPIAELLAPIEQDFKPVFSGEFQGMTNTPVSMDDLQQARKQLINEIQDKLTAEHKQFLLTFKQGAPDWGLLKTPEVERYPAVQWKLHNIRTMPKRKHQAALRKLEKILYG